VGYILAITREDVPWHRVVRSDGSVAMGIEQLELLRREGVPLKRDRVDLLRARYSSGD
jgi:methylated-DNA-protein-cysteine methyltransferase related protein